MNLTPEEQAVIKILQQYDSAENQISMPELTQFAGLDTTRQLRKIIVFLRQLCGYPIISSNLGYFLSRRLEDINKMIQTFKKRAFTTIYNIAAMNKISVAEATYQLVLDLDEISNLEKYAPKELIKQIKKIDNETARIKFIQQWIIKDFDKMEPWLLAFIKNRKKDKNIIEDILEQIKSLDETTQKSLLQKLATNKDDKIQKWIEDIVNLNKNKPNIIGEIAVELDKIDLTKDNIILIKPQQQPDGIAA